MNNIPDFDDMAIELIYHSPFKAKLMIANEVSKALHKVFTLGREYAETEWCRALEADKHFQASPLLHVGGDATIDKATEEYT